MSSDRSEAIEWKEEEGPKSSCRFEQQVQVKWDWFRILPIICLFVKIMGMDLCRVSVEVASSG
jgi:hypothetical protein